MGRLRAKGYKKRLQAEGLDVDKGESIKAMKGGTKEFTDVLGPIKGFLTKNVGRPWAKICSEISAVLPASGGVSLSHARDHLFDMVEQKTQVIDGELCDSRGQPLRGYIDFYVDGKGFLRKTKRKSYRWHKPPKKVFPKTEAGEWLIEDENGMWWACEMAPYEPTERQGITEGLWGKGMRYCKYRAWPIVFDAFLKITVSKPSDIRLYWTTTYLMEDTPIVYCIRKRQLGKREIKKYALRSPAIRRQA